MATSQDRERIIRAAWKQRGKTEWDPETHGRGLMPLNIPATVKMRPTRVGAPLPPYDNLEFRLVRTTANGQPVDSVVCEGVVVETAGAQRWTHRNDSDLVVPAQNELTTSAQQMFYGGRQSRPNFKNVNAVRSWLSGQSDDVAVAFAARAALRVLPAIPLSQWSSAAPATTLQVTLRVFRAAATAWAVAAYPSHRRELNDAARAALFGLGDLKVPSPVRAAVYACATAAGETDTTSRAANAIQYALDAASSFGGSEASRSLLESLEIDAAEFEQRTSPVVIAFSKLWPDQLSDWYTAWAKWPELRFTLLDTDNDWDVWTTWYDERLAGNAPDQDLEIARVRIDNSIWEQEPRRVNAYIKALSDARQDSEAASTDGPEIQRPAEPASGPGPQYGRRNGKLSELASVPSEGETAEQFSLHRLIRRDALAFAKALEVAANRYPELVRTANEYSKLLDVEIIETDVVAIWAVGGALANFAQAYREQNSARTLAEPLEPQLDALLQSVVRQHGAFIMGFKEGRDLTNRADEFAVDASRLQELAEPGTALLAEFTDNRDLVDDRTRELHRPVRDRIVEIGWTSSRIGYSAYLIVRNSTRALIKYSVGDDLNVGTIAGLLTSASILAGDPNADFIRAAIPILQQHGSQLLAFFQHSPEMRAYVEWAIRILNTDHTLS